MRKVMVEVPVWVLEDSDLDAYDESARTRGETREISRAIEAQLPDGYTVTVSARSEGSRRLIRFASVDNGQAKKVLLDAGDGIAVHPMFTHLKVPASMVPRAPLKKVTPVKKAAKRPVEGSDVG